VETTPPVPHFCYNFLLSEETADGGDPWEFLNLPSVVPFILTVFGHSTPPVMQNDHVNVTKVCLFKGIKAQKFPN
jgi:hypothetical protein